VGDIHSSLFRYSRIWFFFENTYTVSFFSDIQFQTLSKYYLQEAEWFHQGFTPSFKEQVSVSVITAGAQMLSIGLLVGMGDVATKEAFEWVIGNSDAIWACGEVSRFMDDMSAFKVRIHTYSLLSNKYIFLICKQNKPCIYLPHYYSTLLIEW